MRKSLVRLFVVLIALGLAGSASAAEPAPAAALVTTTVLEPQVPVPSVEPVVTDTSVLWAEIFGSDPAGSPQFASHPCICFDDDMCAYCGGYCQTYASSGCGKCMGGSC